MPQPTCPELTAGQSRRAAGQAADKAALRAAQGWDVFTGCLMPAPDTRDELSRLQAALPGYEVTGSRRGCDYRFEAVRLPDGPQGGPWCVVSSDLADLWRELAPWIRPVAGTCAARARDP